MSKINRTLVAAVLDDRIASAIIGPGRRLQRVGGEVQGLFGGYAVAVKKGKTITLKHHGFKSPGMRRAMNDFLQAFGQEGSVSFKNGGFTATINGKKLKATKAGISITITKKKRNVTSLRKSEPEPVGEVQTAP